MQNAVMDQTLAKIEKEETVNSQPHSTQKMNKA